MKKFYTPTKKSKFLCYYRYPLIIFNCLLTLRGAIQENINISDRIKLCIFLDYLIKFYHLPDVMKKSSEEIANMSGIDPTFIGLILENYSQPALYLDVNLKYLKTPHLILKLKCHIIILALYLYSFSLNGNLLLSSLNIQPKNLHDILKEVGCSFPNETTEVVGMRKVKNIKDFTVELKAPLKLNYLEGGKFGRNKMK